MSLNSFNSRSTLKVGNKEYEIYRLDALDKQGISTKHLPYSLRILLENLLRTEDGRNVTKEGSPRPGRLEQKLQARQRNRLHPQPRPAPGFHRRPLRSRSSRHARRHAATRRRPSPNQSSATGRTRNRPLRASRRIRQRHRLRRKRPARIPAQQRALLLPPLGPNRIPQPRHRPSRHRHSPPGQSRISSPRSLRARMPTATAQPIPTP